MGSFSAVVSAAHEFLLHAYSGVNNIQGIVIALFAVVLMRSWRQLLPIALGAGVICLVLNQVIPVVRHGGGVNLDQIKLPDFMQVAFWDNAASLLVGFIILIAMFFAVKKVVFMRAGARAGRAHSKA